MNLRRRTEHGMTTIQVAVLFPAILFWIMLTVQYGLWWHAKQIANAAASEAADVAALADGTARLGEDAAASYLTQAGNLSHITIDITRDPTLVTVEINGNAPQLVPGFAWSVAARSTVPVERFIPETER